MKTTHDGIEQLRDDLRKFAADRNWQQFHSPKNLAMALSVEAAELLELFLWKSETASIVLEDSEKSRVREELADVLLYLVRLADQLDVDLVASANHKLKINADKYPVERSFGSSKKYTDL